MKKWENETQEFSPLYGWEHQNANQKGKTVIQEWTKVLAVQRSGERENAPRMKTSDKDYAYFFTEMTQSRYLHCFFVLVFPGSGISES